MSEFNLGFGDAGVELVHHFGDDGSGVYVKETLIPAGRKLSMHTHTFTHKSVLAAGRVAVTADGVRSELQAPRILTMRHGVQHEVEAITDAVWLCVHATNETDPERIDHQLVSA